MADRDQVVDTLLGFFEADAGIGANLRAEVRRLRPLVHADPDLALARLDELSFGELIATPRNAPVSDMIRAVSVETFWRHHLVPERAVYYETPAAYGDFITEQPDPGRQLLRDTRPDEPLVPQAFSWLTPIGEVLDMTGDQIVRALALTYQPPVILFLFALNDLLASGVTVRHSRAFDAVPNRHLEWDPAGLPANREEFVDGDIPRRALTSCHWRP